MIDPTTIILARARGVVVGGLVALAANHYRYWENYPDPFVRIASIKMAQGG
ncbi:MAG: hypothetical protein ACR2KQ_09365 [Actinomycetota bacterium]